MVTTSREWLTVNQFYKRHKGKLGRNTIYDRVRDGSMPSIRVGNRILIPSDALDQMLDRADQSRISDDGQPPDRGET